MKPRSWISLLCVAALTACSSPEPAPKKSPTPANTERKTDDAFPLRPGTYWVYNGTVKWAVANSEKPGEKTISWKMEVVGAEHVGRFDVAVMRGHPSDLAFYEDGKPRSDYLIVKDSTKYYRVQGSAIPDAVQLESKLNFNTQFLEVPPPMGCLARDPEIRRNDDMYCWSVGDPMAVNLDDVKGIEAYRAFKGFELSFRTNPDDQVMTFVPTVGITSYAYRHHGTVSEADVRLVEFHAGVN